MKIKYIFALGLDKSLIYITYASLSSSWTSLTWPNVDIPRRRHGHRLAKHGYNLTSDTRYFLARPLEEIACVGRKIVAVFGESVSVSVSVSASWNASLNSRNYYKDHCT